MKVNKLTWVLKQKWFWKLFVILLAMIIVPFLLVWIVLSLPPVYLVWTLIVALAVWAVLKGYQDRAERKREEGENRTTQQVFEPALFELSSTFSRFVNSLFQFLRALILSRTIPTVSIVGWFLLAVSVMLCGL